MTKKNLINAQISARDLAGLIGSHLAEQGIDATLVGGTCVSIYSNNLYQSDDLDFVDRAYTPSKKLKQALVNTGHSTRHLHPDHATRLH